MKPYWKLAAISSVIVVVVCFAWGWQNRRPRKPPMPRAASQQQRAAPKPKPAPRITNSPVVASEAIDSLLPEPGKRPDFNTLAKLDLSHKPALLRAFRETQDLAQRRALVWALAQLGGSDVAALLMQSLRADYGNKPFSQAEEDVLCDMVKALGLVAEQDDAAYKFLKDGTDVATWNKWRTWQSPRGDYADNLLVSYSIQGVAISGRSDAMTFLDSLGQRDAAYLHAFAGDITEGAFYQHLRLNGGVEQLMQHLLTPTGLSQFEEWVKTDEGRSWLEWANDRMRGPAPPR